MNKDVLFRYIPAVIFMVLGFVYGRYGRGSIFFLIIIIVLGLVAILIAEPEKEKVK
jgi:hypothetical protein